MTKPSSYSLPIVLVGLPGTGKSKVGEALAARMGLPHADTDLMVQEQTGMSIDRIFASEGEPGFRRRELEALRQALTSPGVISVGGGAVETPEVRELLSQDRVTVVRICADQKVLLERVTRSNKRPLLRKDPQGTLRRLAERRNPLFEQVESFAVESTAAPVGAVVERIEEHLGLPTTIPVQGQDTYPVLVGSGVCARVAGFVPTDATKALLVYPKSVEQHARALTKSLGSTGVEVVHFNHPDGEDAKTLTVAEQGWALLGENQVGRRDIIVTLGGGATTDLGGFLAATWLRGIRVLHAPTTLLGMVDAAVGGKTGINTPSGKNLVGSFHNPLLTAADLDYLVTLPPAEYTAGMAEVLKCGFIADPKILRLVERHPQIKDPNWALTEGRTVLEELVARAVKVKARVVSSDFKEGGLREILNYGHTLAHAIEKNSQYRVRHGEAVAIGCVFAAEMAAHLGMLTAKEAQTHREVFDATGLPTSYEGDPSQLVELLYSDKKTRGGQLRFVLLDSIGSAATYPVSAETALRVAASSKMFK